MSKQISGKNRTPKSLIYNSWFPIDFGAISAGTAPIFRPLGLNHKFTHLSYTMPGTGFNVGISHVVNIKSGVVSTDPVNNTSYGYIDLGGTFAAGDTITITIAGTAFKTIVNGRSTTLQKVAAAFVTSLMLNPAFSVSYIANSLGGEVVIQKLVYDTTTPTFVVSVSSAAGTATANGATMIAGTAAVASPTQPVSDQTGIGIVPSGTAVTGNALFPVDIILPTFNATQAGQTGSVYAYANYDAIWPSQSAVSLTVVNNGPIVSNSSTFVLYGVPVDNHPMQPEEAASYFHLSQNIL